MPKIKFGVALVVLAVLVGCKPVIPVSVQLIPTQTVYATLFSTAVSTSSGPVVIPTFPTVTSTVSVTSVVTVSATAVPITTAIPTVTVTATATPKVISEDDFSRGVILEIPKIKLKSSLEIAKQNQNGLDFSSLGENPVLVETHRLGEDGVALIIGHRQWGIQPKVFAKLDRLEKGDTAVIRTGQVEVTFAVEESLVVLPSAVWQELERLDSIFLKGNIPAVVFLTCTPYGTSKKRLMVVAAMKGE